MAIGRLFRIPPSWSLLILCFLPLLVQAQGARTDVRGIVRSEEGVSLKGVTVVIKNPDSKFKAASLTDSAGVFSFYQLPSGSNYSFTIAYVGYETQTLEGNKLVPGANFSISIKLKDAKQSLSEVVVIGYGTQKKRDLTGAVVSADLETFKNAPNTNIVQSLQGTVPGLNVGQVTSSGATPSISIRGKNTLSGNQDILIVLDGIIYTSSLSSINPDDIASIDILKDASATAVYGAQAANGVMLITTKKGRPGKTVTSISSSYATSDPTKNLHPMDRAEFLDFTKQFWYDKAYVGPNFTQPNSDFRLVDYLPDNPMLDNNQPDGISPDDYDWWNAGTRRGSMFENRLSLSGGTNRASYLVSFENIKQKGYIMNDDFKRNSVRLNLDIHPYKWLKFGIQTFGSFVNQDDAEPDLASLIRQNPLIPPYDQDGKIVPYPFGTIDLNPFISSDVNDKERHNYFFANAYADINLPIKGLTYRLNYGNNYRIDENFRSSAYGAGLTGEAYKRHTSYYDYTLDNILNYSNSFGDHSIKGTLLYGASERKYNYTDANAKGFDRLTLGYNSLELGELQYTNSDAWSEALLYQMARLNYKYKNRYLLTATVRQDGFSGFAENNKTAIFPSTSLAWIISDEKFFNVSWVNYLKLRTGWGVSGNLTNRYNSLAKVTTGAGYVFGDGGATQTRQQLASMANTDLTWEKTEGFNAGLDFTLFNLLTGSVDAYQTTTKDLLYNIAIPTITGFASVSSNIGKIRNRGLELNLTSTNLNTKNFGWTTSFNISFNSNKILTLFGKDGNGDGKEDDLISSGLFIGHSISSIYNYVIDGIWQLDDEIPAGYNPGNYKLNDINQDGQITVDDRRVIGKEDPYYRLGVTNKLRYKDFSFSFFVNAIQGGNNGYLGSNSGALTRGDANARRWNMISEMADEYWSPSNPDGIYSRAINGGAIVPTAYQSRNFIRLQDVSLSYNLPHKILDKLKGIDAINFFISGKNLITITKWKGWDPEANSNYYGRPVLRTFNAGINVTL